MTVADSGSNRADKDEPKTKKQDGGTLMKMNLNFGVKSETPKKEDKEKEEVKKDTQKMNRFKPGGILGNFSKFDSKITQ